MFTDPSRYDKYGYDFLLHDKVSIRTVEQVAEVIAESPMLEEANYEANRAVVEEFIQNFWEEHPLSDGASDTQ